MRPPPRPLALLLSSLLTLAALTSPAPARADETPPPATPPPTAPTPTPPPRPSNHRINLRLAFSHWFSSALGNPDGYNTPALMVGVRPGVRYLELCLRYSFLPGGTKLPSGDTHLVGFASLEALATREMRVGRQSLGAFAGLTGNLMHTGTSGVSGGYGILFGAELSILTGARHDHAVGIHFATRGINYLLPASAAAPGEADTWHRDIQFDLGVTTSFL